MLLNERKEDGGGGRGSVSKQNKMSNTNIIKGKAKSKSRIVLNTNDISLIKSSIALTIAAILEAEQRCKDKGSISLDLENLEGLYSVYDSLFSKLEQEEYRIHKKYSIVKSWREFRKEIDATAAEGEDIRERK
ncbi:MAG TPA: hypothetical protein VKA95_00090 [Nitrososphaeraceae archaeon]|nr:hypothetical protein [Nitrososphaeraceae archaeon]